MKMTKTRFNEGLINCISAHIYELQQLIPDHEELMEASFVTDYEEAAKNEGWERARGDGWLLKEPLQAFISMDAGANSKVVNGMRILRDDEEMWKEVERLIREDNPTATEDDIETLMGEVDYESVDHKEWIHVEDGVTTMIEDAQELCGNYDIELYDQEVFEHWLVDRHLAYWLESQGAKVVDILGLQDVWCRTCTGQACYLDFNIDQDS